MYMKKILVVAACFICFMFCSCMADTSGQSYELSNEKWYGVLNGGAEVSLEFSDNTATLKLKSGEDEINLNGLYVIDDTTFIIFNQEFKQSYSFNYTVNGDTLVLEYCGNKIEIEKYTEN